ncbi:membrane protein [Shewanella mangrovi]|uniref:Membrane protein n=1 Tax=Shewanella mangrovi TaxID=1515746 RepID=A0A094JG79_9GAMM|nr:DUF368 domain-containing protein [Shewanella mangrovi]KFZ37039.1 membrane protein [Shewanella mangrovi]
MQYLLTYLKGLAMGAADVVPGVSGGTIAFITGIYDTLLESIRRVNPTLWKRYREQGFKAVLAHINASFLLSLFAGIITSILTLAKLISWLLVEHPIPVWSFFFGLIIISVVHMLKQVRGGVSLVRLLLFAIGVLIAWGITVVSPVNIEATYVNVFFGGAIAICAMILPGISGSFILLLLGLYPAVLAAAKNLQLDILACFAVGAVSGILCFSHLLSMLLRRFKDATLIFLTGLMVGTLGKIWPWKQTLTWRENSHGEQVPLLQQNLSPMAYEHATGQSHQLWLALIYACSAILLVLALEYFSQRKHHD